MKKIMVILIVFVNAIASLSAQTLASSNHSGTDHTVRTIPLDSIEISDPFILPDKASMAYYLTGTGGYLWKSKDLKLWQGPYNVIQIDTTSWMGRRPMIWAAELHQYKNKFYCFATFTNSETIVDNVPRRYNVERRGSHVLVSDKPNGPFKSMKNNFYTPPNQSTLDGTFWIENGVPYLIYCHEWMQVVDGTMDAVQLAPDLSGPVGKPITLFRASEAEWVKEMNSIGEITFGMKLPGWVTDGPFLFKTKTGRLGMLWSSWGSCKYAQGVAYSASGKIAGPWIQEKESLVPNNAGHGMLFRTFEGKLIMSLHYQSIEPYKSNQRKPMLLEVDDSGDKIKILGRYNP